METRINYIGNDYTKYLVSIIRDRNSKKKDLSKAMFLLGIETGKFIFGKCCLDSAEINTPMNQLYSGVVFNNSLSVIISTKNDFTHFASGCKSLMKNSISGFMDFGDFRGKDVYTASLRAISLPDISRNTAVLNLIILKSILATGCTAISLTQRSLEVYRPKNLFIASVFYSAEGLTELAIEFQNAEICLYDEADKLDSNGMLIPGIGNIDRRIGN